MKFLAVGDVVVDEFIRLKDASVHCNINNEDCEICMRWGDKIPFEFAELIPAVGNAANAAVAAARLGLSSGLRTYVGKDAYGVQSINQLQGEGVDTQYVETVAGKKTNHHYVLWYESQRTILIKHEVFDYALPPLTTAPEWLYFSSLGENSEPYHEQWMAYLDKHPEVKLVFQPGTYQIKFSQDKKEYWAGHPDDFAALYKRTEIFFCNKEEAERILGLPAGTDMKQLLQSMHALGPKLVVITDDVRGAAFLDESGAMFHCPRYPDPRPPYEITGAGDALASGTTVALALGKSLSEAVKWGSVNASAVLQEIGAQKGLLTREQLEKNLANPPAAWEITPI
jgi:ribokinase